jgi:hypothetical protein
MYTFCPSLISIIGNSGVNGLGIWTPTTEEWIEKAKQQHGYKYDYSNANYVNIKTNVRNRARFGVILFYPSYISRYSWISSK